MKIKHVLPLIMLSVMVFSCSLTKQNIATRKSLNGNWTLTDIGYANDGYFKSTLFNDVDSKCFKNSQWFFLSNNSTGSYNIVDANCITGIRNIRWSITDVNGVPSQFQFKFIDEKKKDLNNGAGYVFRIASLTESEMVLNSNINTGTEIITMVLTFKKSL